MTTLGEWLKEQPKGPDNVKDWLDELYAMENTAAMLDRMFLTMDTMLWLGHEAQSWPEVEEVLDAVDFERAKHSLLIGLLTITSPVKGKLRNRAEFYKKVEETLQYEIERDKRLLQGLE